ncbi:MAG TPA: glycosyltransferase [Acidimicrobiales bacterium]|nr:glycosyltransferase [Acidimicrobiales bacterium]
MTDGGDRTTVLWLTKGLGPGGAERLLLSFARNADHERFELHAAYLLPWKDHLVADLEAAGVTTRCLAGSKPWDVRWWWRLRRLAATTGVEVVHHHSPLVAAQSRLVLRTLPRARRPRSVTTEHNVWGSHQRLTRFLNAATIGLDDHVFAVSEQVRGSMSPSVRGRVEVLIHGVDVDAIAARRAERTDARAEYGLGDDDLVVVTVANLRANKDHPTMLRAARHLVDDGVPVTFLAVGQGPLEDELRAMKDHMGLGDRFRFLGYQADPIRVLAAGDVFCLSSRYEGLPIALLEALSLGLPVAATSVGGVPTVITDGVEGRLVPPGDPTALAGAIAELADPELRRRMAVAAASRSREFSVLHAVERQQEVYDELAGVKPSTRP